MKYCETCKNVMLLVADGGEHGVKYRCPCCTRSVNIEPGRSHTVLTRRPQHANDKYARFLTPDLSRDATLPRLPGTPCPFCREEGGVVFVKYSDAVDHLYHCGKCVKFWLNGQVGPTEVSAQEDPVSLT
jgi:DNA-directed RNA polymerase subunit M/transcription elongation factor TFIIS